MQQDRELVTAAAAAAQIPSNIEPACSIQSLARRWTEHFYLTLTAPQPVILRVNSNVGLALCTTWVHLAGHRSESREWLWLQMAQKQSALAALQGQVAAVGRSSEGNAAQIAALQEAMAGLQSQRLDLQRADLSGRLAVLQDIAAQASLSGAAKARTLLSCDPLSAAELEAIALTFSCDDSQHIPCGKTETLPS